jgi:hypothetical protein
MKQILKITLIAAGLVNLMFGSMASARVFSGYLEKSNKSYFLTKNLLRLELKFVDISISKVLNKLNNKDFLSIDASLMPAEYDLKRSVRTLNVRSINYVGLSDLLGFWKDQSGLCYYFSNFTNFKVFIPTYKMPCSTLSINRINSTKTTSYNYFINPDDAVWSMLISNDKKQYLAELYTLSNQTRKLISYDSLDGRKLSEIILKKVKNQ